MKKNHSYTSWLPAAFLAVAFCVLLASMSLAGSDPEKVYAPSAGEFTLKVNPSNGVSGYPAMGTQKRKAGTIVQYNYSPASGFDGLVVKLDGAAVAASGAFVMSADRALDTYVHTYYTLRVMETGCDVGTDEPHRCHVLGNCIHGGTPVCGIHKIRRGETVSYHLRQGCGAHASLYLAAYPPAAGTCPPELRNLGRREVNEYFTGTFVMDRDYTLVLTINMH